MAHTLKIAGASYEGVSVVYFQDADGNIRDYVDGEEMAEKAFKGGLEFYAPLNTNNSAEIITDEGNQILVSKKF